MFLTGYKTAYITGVSNNFWKRVTVVTVFWFASALVNIATNGLLTA
jgi:hypothetical protein